MTAPLGFRILEGVTHPAYSIDTFEEEREFREKHWTVREGDVVIDAGASYGAYTLPALKAGAAHVYAFEPERTVRVDLQRNVSLNEWRDRFTAVGHGLWDGNGLVNFYDYAPHWPKGTISGKFSMVRLDDWATKEELGRLDWLKLDGEGAEERAIRGGLLTLERFRPRLIIECHVFLDAEVVRKVREMLPGYEFEEFDREPCVMLVGRHR